MAAVKRTPGQRERDLLLIQALYCKGDTFRSIAQQVTQQRPYSLTHQTIARDIEDLLNRWRQTMVQNMDELQAAELLRINRIEREAWEAWERSKQKKERTLSEQKTGESPSTRAQIQREDLIGDPRFLEQVRWCITKRCEILGLDAPLKVKSELTGKDGGPIEANVRGDIVISNEYRDAFLRALQRCPDAGVVASCDGGEVDPAPADAQAS